jgi:glycosyltransferase involved in cell wall biosynthesis
MSIPRLFGPSDIATPLQIRALAKKLGIEVLHGHGAKGGFLARVGRVGAPRVALYTPHGGVLNYPPSSTAGRAFRLIERTLVGATDAMIFESGFAQRAFAEQIVAPTCPAPVIHNGIAPAEFEPIDFAPDAADFIFIGEFRAVKGITYLLDALVDVRAPGGRPATLAMAGGGADLDAVKAQIARLGLTERVRLLGVTPARQALRHGRCELVPSLAESLPYVVLEAAAAGMPVIATTVGGIAEIFGPTADQLVPPADSGALRRAMQAVLDDPDAASAAAAARLVHVRAGFSVALMVDRIEALYRDVLARRLSN